MHRHRRPLGKNEQISKTLSYILRHGAHNEGIEMTKDGFVKLEDILNYKSFKGRVTKEDVIDVVNNCPKQRFTIKYLNETNDNSDVASNTIGDESILIRANQGHSIDDLDIELTEITDHNSIKNCIHGTYYRFWESIKKKGLSKMNRTHIHFAEDFPDSDRVISGMRNSCQIAIYVNVKEALKDGLKFYRSANNVILCSGDENGFLKTKYFLKVVDVKTKDLLFE